MKKIMKRASLMLTFLMVFAGAGQMCAQSFPSKSLRLIAGFPAGGPTGVVARLAVLKMSEAFGRRLAVDIRGAGCAPIRHSIHCSFAP